MQFKKGDIIRRLPSFHYSSARWDKDFEVVECGPGTYGNLVLKGSVPGAEHMDDKNGNSKTWDSSKFELVRGVNPFGITVETKTTSRVQAGQIETTATGADISWSAQDDDGDVLVAIDSMYMKAADLRQAADLFKALAEKLEATA